MRHILGTHSFFVHIEGLAGHAGSMGAVCFEFAVDELNQNLMSPKPASHP